MAPANCPSFCPHDHVFGQDEKRPAEVRALAVAVLTTIVMVVEIFAGLWTGSMALLADGVHMGTHAFALGLAAAAYVFARRQASNRRYSFGTGKVNELAGYSSALILGVSVLLLLYEVIGRLLAPRPIAYDEAMMVAGIGLAVNVVSALVLTGQHGHGHEEEHDHGWRHDNNLRAALFHVVADALTSVAALGALLAAKYSGWVWLDPLVALAACCFIAAWAWDLLRDTSHILLDVEAVDGMRERILNAIEADGDSRVSDLHLWSIGQGAFALIISVVNHVDRNADYYYNLLSNEDSIVHVSLSVKICNFCNYLG
jgi:cation diffusion facilitator family transporter